MIHAKKLLCLLIALVAVFTVYSQNVFPLKTSADGRYLVDRNNKPFPILGRTAWFIITQSESGYKQFLSNTLAHGHNAVEMAVITHWPTGNHAPYTAAGQAPFLKTLNGRNWDGTLTYNDINMEGPDLLTPNEAYWQFVDSFLSYCEDQGILVLMFTGYTGYNGGEQGWLRELVANGPQKCEAYGAWIAARFKNRPNIIWMLLGDMGKFNAAQQQAEAALIKGLKSVPGQLSTEYTAESFSGQNAADNETFGHEMTMNASYTWELGVPVPFIARKAYEHTPVMPSFLLEEPYDEEGPDGNSYNPNATQPVRRFQWWGWLSTIGGYMSGNGYVWPFIDPVWQFHLNTQAAMDMARLNGFIKAIDWWKLIPSGLGGMKNLITAGNTSDTSDAYVAAAAAGDGSLLLAYIPPAHSGSITIDMSVLKGKVYAAWFDPAIGNYTSAAEGSLPASGSRTFTPPGKNMAGDTDWVLILSTKQVH